MSSRHIVAAGSYVLQISYFAGGVLNWYYQWTGKVKLAEEHCSQEYMCVCVFATHIFSCCYDNNRGNERVKKKHKEREGGKRRDIKRLLD